MSYIWEARQRDKSSGSSSRYCASHAFKLSCILVSRRKPVLLSSAAISMSPKFQRIAFSKRNRPNSAGPALSSRLVCNLVCRKNAKLANPCVYQHRKECSGGDLNPHALRHTPLKRTCLPFHHPSFCLREGEMSSSGPRERKRFFGGTFAGSALPAEHRSWLAAASTPSLSPSVKDSEEACAGHAAASLHC